MKESSKEIDRWAHAVIGAAIEVHRQLGAGFLESVYEEAMAIELELRDIPFAKQHSQAIEYKGRTLGVVRFDFFIADALIVELKAVERILPIHHAQVMNYLKATGLPLALLLNFNVPILRDGIQRIVLS